MNRRDRAERRERVAPEVALHRALATRRKELNTLVAQYARVKGVPHSHVHAELRRQCGGPSLAQATTDQVESRITKIREWRLRPPLTSPGGAIRARGCRRAGQPRRPLRRQGKMAGMVFGRRGNKGMPELVTDSAQLFQAGYLWIGITVVMLLTWWLRGFTPPEWPLVATPLTASLTLLVMAVAVKAKPRRTKAAIAWGIVLFVVLLGAILALALPFFLSRPSGRRPEAEPPR